MPIPPHPTTIRDEWLDYNGHLRDAFYLLIFSESTDALMDHIGLDAATRERTHATLFTLECHLNFLREVKRGAAVQVRTQLLGHDAKRLHIHQALILDDDDKPAAVCEQMLMHMDSRGPKSAAFAADVRARVEAIAAVHAAMPQPPYVGRVMRLPPARA